MTMSTSNDIVSQEVLTGTVGVNINVLGVLGQGSYGQVRECEDENGLRVASKCCDTDATGIPKILEASIMSTINHPNLNRSLRTHATPERLYIIQDLASKGDMAKYVRRIRTKSGATKRPHILSSEKLRRWCFSLVQAVACLHRQKIIHADIKAGNVLIYEDDNIRLSDFTLSVYKSDPHRIYNHTVCTCTHRPLECLLNRGWDYSLDIWSLGCTFYEMAYGELLFPYQGNFEEPDSKGKKPKSAKLKMRQRAINCIIDWALNGPNSPIYGKSQDYSMEYRIQLQHSMDKLKEFIGIEEYPIEYNKYNLSPEFNNHKNAVFNTLLLRMLNVDPSKRPNIFQILDHPYFRGLERSEYSIISTIPEVLPPRCQTRIERYIDRYSEDDTVRNLAMELFCRSIDVKEVSEQIKSATCVWIAHKITHIKAPDLGLPKHQIYAAERILCHHLAFRVHISAEA